MDKTSSFLIGDETVCDLPFPHRYPADGPRKSMTAYMHSADPGSLDSSHMKGRYAPEERRIIKVLYLARGPLTAFALTEQAEMA